MKLNSKLRINKKFFRVAKIMLYYQKEYPLYELIKREHELFLNHRDIEKIKRKYYW
jgi:hypothetical protein